MQTRRTPWIAAAAAFAAIGFAGSAQAQATWNLSNPTKSVGATPADGCRQAATNANTFNNAYTCGSTGASGVTATISAWSNDRGPSSTGGTDGQASAANSWYNAYLSDQGGSGFGVASRTEGLGTGSPNHSVDNLNPGTYDFVMVQFTSAVILNAFAVGWGASDSDVTVMRWGGAAAPTFGTAAATIGGNQTVTNTIGTGAWELVGNYSDVCRNSSNNLATNTTCNQTNSTRSTGSTAASSYWLIAAYNTTMGGGTWTTGNDGFKLNRIRLEVSQRPPPAWTRRRTGRPAR
jgi:hypothetical protein